MSDKNLPIWRNPYRSIGWLASVVLSSSLLAACGGGSSSSTSTPPAPPAPPPKLSGQSSFVSADPSFSSVAFATSSIKASADAVGNRKTVLEGDVYQVLDNGKTILNVNPYRGLQIVDIRDVSKPSIIGRAAMAGSPVEMYRIENRVYILLNGYKSYQRTLRDGQESLASFYGAAVVEVDISQTTAPRILSTTRLPGYIQTSRMTSAAGKNALFLAVSDHENFTTVGLSKVYSYALNAQGVAAKSVLELGGNLQAIAAIGDRLLVARNQDKSKNIGSKVAVIDISNAEGSMRLGADVQVTGSVRSKNNMDVTGNVLRIVSGDFERVVSPNLPPDTSNVINTSHIETFDISDITQPKTRDHKTFGNGKQFFTTTFMPDRVFFVSTHTDPFYAFSISSSGMLQEEKEFIISGKNDFLKPAQNNSRLIGVGRNDENNRRVLSVSLYDSGNLKNRQPLIVRAATDLSNSWSEANWDDRAFTVLENATNVLALDGKTVETGLVLLPYSGWDSASSEYRSGVQIFSFSSNTLTRRGTMLQANTVRRSFQPQSQLAANLSDSELNLFDLQNLNQPVQRASLSLAESYSQFVAFAKVGARYRNGATHWNSQYPTPGSVEFVSLDAANGKTILGKIAVPHGSRLYNVGEKLVVVSNVDGEERSRVSIWDISNPALAVLMGKVDSSEIVATTSGDFHDISTARTDSALLPYYGQSDAKVVGNALVFVKNSLQPQYAKTNATSLIGYSSKLRLSVVDLSNPAAPRFQPKIELADKQNMVGVIANGNNLWINYKVEATANANQQAQAKYFVKRLDLSTPSAPIMGAEINIPGQLMAVAGDQLYSKDFHWTTNNTIENSLNVSTLQDGLAYRQASNVLANQLVTSLQLDGANIAASLLGNDSNSKASASLFTLQNNNFVAKSSVEMPVWGTISQVRNSKALLGIYDGYLLYDFTQAIAVPQAFFDISGWGPTALLAGNKIYIPVSLYGLYQFDFDTVNLSKPGV